MTRPSTNTWQLGFQSRPLPLTRALLRAGSPFVMVDLLAFREQATGDFTGRTGREAYEQYLRTLDGGQASTGSKLLWNGDLAAADDGRPPFETAALLQYASPRSFLRSGRHGGRGAAARKAALAGGWRIAAQTVDSAPWEVAHREVLVELVGFGEVGRSWETLRRDACTSLDGELIWRGRTVERVIGDGPHIDQILVTAFAGHKARAAGQELVSLVARETGVETWWTYLSHGTATPEGPSG